MLSRSWVDARERLVEVLVLSPLSVAQPHQGAGWAPPAGRRGRRGPRLGAPAVFLEGAPATTARAASSPALRAASPALGPRPGPAFQVVVLDAREAWMTGALVYCEPFWAHDCVGLRDPELARIEQMFDF